MKKQKEKNLSSAGTVHAARFRANWKICRPCVKFVTTHNVPKPRFATAFNHSTQLEVMRWITPQGRNIVRCADWPEVMDCAEQNRCVLPLGDCGTHDGVAWCLAVPEAEVAEVAGRKLRCWSEEYAIHLG
jgi:hypothetical protein